MVGEVVAGDEDGRILLAQDRVSLVDGVDDGRLEASLVFAAGIGFVQGWIAYDSPQFPAKRLAEEADAHVKGVAVVGPPGDIVLAIAYGAAQVHLQGEGHAGIAHHASVVRIRMAYVLQQN